MAALLFAAVAASATAASTRSIFSIPAADWAALNQSIGGKLHFVQPLALPCHALYNDGHGGTQHHIPSLAKCNEVILNRTNAGFIADHPGGYINANFGTCQENQQGCPVGSIGTCYQGNLPSYHIDVRDETDVAAGLLFAQKNSIRVAIKNTGHDYRGRSSSPESLAIWTHNVQPPIRYAANFTPEGCSTGVGPVLTYGAGQGFDGIFEAAHQYGVMMIGGASPTVGASGGWVTGGGHSSLSSTHGLGVDNVMEMKAVLANGSFVTANRCQNQDLFFALRGGGGGTFGVLMETTSRVYPEIPLQHATIIAPNLNLINGIDQVVRLIVNNTAKWSEDGWGGYMTAGIQKYLGLLFIDMVTPILTLEEAQASMMPAIKFARSLLANGSLPIQTEVKTEPNFYSFYKSTQSSFTSIEGSYGVGDGVAMASRLLPVDNFSSEERREELIAAMTKSLQQVPFPGSFLMVPPLRYGLPGSDEPGGPGEASINPRWRSSYYHSTFQFSWNPNDATYGGYGSAAAVYEAASRSVDPLRAITPEAAYQNEADTYEPHPEESFWGTANHERLLKIKRAVDPNNLLTCFRCVGWDPSDPRYRCYPEVR